MRYAAELDDAGDAPPPPVETWNPERAGEIDIVIARDGTWFHEGAPIRRAKLARLFSTILRREGDQFFLVTPAEKLKIKVEDAPFVAVLMRVEGEGRAQRLTFATNLGDDVVAGPDHALVMRSAGGGGQKAPYINVRRGLEARIARAVYYDLAALGERRRTGAEDLFGVWSAGIFFPLE